MPKSVFPPPPQIIAKMLKKTYTGSCFLPLRTRILQKIKKKNRQTKKKKKKRLLDLLTFLVIKNREPKIRGVSVLFKSNKQPFSSP